MNDPVQLAPTLAIFEDDGDFTVRVNESPLAKSLTPALLKAIGELTKAKKLTLLTPTDTKIFKLNGTIGSVQSTAAQPSPSEAPPPKVRRISQDESAPPAPELATEAMDEYDQALAEAKKAEQEIAQMERTNRQNVDFPEPEADPEPRVRKRDRTRPEPAPNASCGRCGGAGSIGEGTCPVCRGKGVVAKWGTGRR